MNDISAASVLSGVNDNLAIARNRAVGGLAEDPEQAARAVQLAQVTGVPSTAIYGDVDNFVDDQKAKATSYLVRNNPYLAEYVNSHPLASAISNDDYHALDEHSENLQKFYGKSILQKIHEGIGFGKIAAIAYPDDPLAAFKGIVKNQYTGPDDGTDISQTHPNLYKELRDARSILETGLETISTPIAGAQRLLSHYFGREAGAILQHEIMRGDILSSGTPHELIEAYKIAEPWLSRGSEPPAGLHPALDKIVSLQAKDDIKSLDDVIQSGAATETQQRSPEFAANFNGLHGDREIGIYHEAARKLYGDKPSSSDDGLLGWIPNFDERLATAEQFGGDVWVPAKDFAAKIDPEVWKESLRDFIRTRVGGLTLDEAKNLEDKQSIAEPLASLRSSAEMEPLLSVGDRKVTLERKQPQQKTGQQLAEEHGLNWTEMSVYDRQKYVEEAAAGQGRPAALGAFHDVDILDEAGNNIGTINISEQKGGKQLYIEMIQAGTKESKFYQPNFLGPSLVRDIKRQLKQLFPNAESITGHRVSGARERAGVEMTAPMPVVKLDVGEDPQSFRDLLQAHWEQVGGGGAEALFHTEEKGLAANSIMGQMVLSELRRIAPEAESDVAHGIDTPAGPAYGAYLPDIKSILVSLESKNPIGTARHEAIHALRDMGLFTAEEWATLEGAALSEGWMNKFNVAERWGRLAPDVQIEESIAEAYRDWREGADAPKEVHTIFEKMKAFFEGLRKRVAEHLGLRSESWDEIFQKVESGEVGGRGAAEDAGRAEPRLQPIDEPEGTEPSLSLYDRAKALGITQAHEDRMLKLVMQRNAEDFKAAQRRAEEEGRRRSNKELKARRTDLRDEVRDAMSQRQDISIDRLMSETQTKLHPDFLTDEQKALLPKDYIQKKNGVNPDDIAPQFGYPSGDALVEHLSRLTEDRRRAGMSPRDYLNRLIDVETDRRLNQEFGDWEGKVKDEALDQALTETQMNLTHEQTLAYALKAGVEPKMTAKDVEAMVRGALDNLNVKEMDPYKMLQAAGREGKKANEAGAKGNWAEAYRLAQTQQHATIGAKIAKEYLRKERNLDRLFRTYAKVPTKEVAKRIDQAYYNYIQQVMTKVGQKIARTQQGLADALEKEPYDSIVAFVDAKSATGHSLYLPEFLRDSAPPLPVEKMSYGQFKELHDFVARMDHSARDEMTITRQGEKVDLDQTIDGLIAGLPKSLPPRTFDPKPENLAKETLKSNWWSLITVRSMAKRLDRGDPKGLLTDIIANRATAADANETALWKAQVAKLKDVVGKIPDMDKLVENNLFRDPNTGNYIPMRKRNVLAVLQYWGERTNRIKLIKGWDVNPDEVEAWLGKNTKPEDWDRAQAIGKMFDELFNQASNMSRRVSGVGIEKLPLQKFTDPHGIDRDGWYSPAKYESLLPGKSDVLLGKTAIDDNTYFRADTPQGYGHARTGYVAPFDLSLDAVPVRMKQMIHDIAWRETILDMGKIVYNSKFQRALNARFGKHQTDEFKTYVADMANSANIDSLAEYYRETAFEYFRRNTVGTLVGLNPSTYLKHTLTAGINSITQVGGVNFLREFNTMFRGSDQQATTNLKMAFDKSEVIQNRMQNIVQLIRGQDPKFSFEPGKFAQWREIMMHLGSFPVAMGDFMSTVPTWLAAYKDKIASGETEGFARSFADRAVIEAHGSSMRSNQPSVMRRTGALARTFSSLYGFFSHMLQKQYEFAWKAKDIYNGEKPLDIQGHWAPSMMGNLFSYWLAPALIEEAITPYTNKERESWFVKGAKVLALGGSASLLYVRDFVRALFFGGDTGGGLIGTAMQSGTNLVHDIMKHQPTSPDHMGKVIKDSVTLAGVLTGLTNAQEGKTAEYVYRYLHGLERPKGPWDVAVGARYGTTEKHSHTFAEWWKHMNK